MTLRILLTAPILSLAALLAITPVAHADHTGRDFDALVQSLTPTEIENAELLTLDAQTQERFLLIAQDQANIWGDTILEGDYIADGKTALDSVHAIIRDGVVIAYRITYSETAWDTSTCDYDSQNERTIEGCTQGRISESSFVSANLESWTRDDNAFAEFSD